MRSSNNDSIGRKIRRKLGVLGLASAGAVVAGFVGAYVVQRLAYGGVEPVQYCLYSIAAPPPGCSAFHLCNGIYIYSVQVPGGTTCASAVSVCGQNVDLFGSGSYSGTCPTS